MSENTLLSFSIFSKFTFLRFAEKLRGVSKKWPTSQNLQSRGGPNPLKKFSKKSSLHPHFWEKPTFFHQIWKVVFSAVWWDINIIFKPLQPDKASSWHNFLNLFLFRLFASLRNQKCETYFPLKKGLFFQKFEKCVIPLSSYFKFLFRKKIKKIKIEK